MAKAKNGDTVRVHYTGTLEDGTVFDSSKEREPLQFTIGESQVIPGFEQAVIGMEPGETKAFNIPADQAYGQRREDMKVTIDRAQLPANLEPKEGQQLQLGQQEGQIMIVTVTDVTDAGVTIDANHPLAGKDLAFDIELVEVA